MTNPIKEPLWVGIDIAREGDDNCVFTLRQGGKVIYTDAWGSFAPVVRRAPEVLKMISEPYCLGVNADGQPKHPLYVSYTAPVIKYEVKNVKV